MADKKPFIGQTRTTGPGVGGLPERTSSTREVLSASTANPPPSPSTTQHHSHHHSSSTLSSSPGGGPTGSSHSITSLASVNTAAGSPRREDKPAASTPHHAHHRKEVSTAVRTKTIYSWDGFTSPFDGVFPSDLYSEFNKLLTLARQANTQVPTPEIIFVGKAGHGKSSLIEALIGHQFTYVAEERRNTRRPLFFSMVNNPQLNTPRVTLKKDIVCDLPDTETSISDLEDELEKRNTFSDIPIYLSYEVKNCFNLTLIDTPGILPLAEEKSAEVLNIVLEQCLPSHRFIVCVEEAREWENMDMLDIIKKVDPKLSRSVFAYTDFKSRLRLMSTSTEVNKYLSSCPTERRGFFVSLVPGRDRATYTTARQYQSAVNEIHNEDQRVLDNLRFDKRFNNRLGVQALKRHLLVECAWRRYLETLPEVLKQIRQQKRQTEDDHDAVDRLIESLHEAHLRTLATSYSALFLGCVEKVISGSLEGNPSLNGETLSEEREREETGPWLDSNNRPLKNMKELVVPYAESKLYGSQQFERLLLEFKAICEKTTLPDITAHDVSTATGPHKLKLVSNFVWAASDIAQKRSEKAFRPLIEQLYRRATYIMKRVIRTVDFLIAQKKKESDRDKALATRQWSEPTLEDYPFYVNELKTLYWKYVDKMAASAKEKCLDEFYCTRIIHWETMSELLKGVPSDADGTKKMVTGLAQERFEEIKKRITKNVMLKTYNFFLVPLQNELWGEITSSTSSLSSDEIHRLFETEMIKDKLKTTRDKLSSFGDKLVKDENDFLSSFSKFSHASVPKPRE